MRLPRIIRDFRDSADAIDDDKELEALTQDAAHDVGFDWVAALHSPSLIRRSDRLVRWDNYPMGWDRRLIGRGQKIVDPILSRVRRRTSGALWSDILSGARLTDIEQAILNDATRFGIRQGFTVPANVPGEPEASISFATRSMRTIGRERQLIADSIGRIAFDAARRIMGFTAMSDLSPHIADRVRECIFWIAHGKTDQDIADILHIGLETVRTYVKSAFRTLGVITRAQLVHEALRLGLIDFVPSIPPFG
jgi:LuxR family quorum-sensing system transcriptional regulator CciR